jgi:hypothetical protein
VTRTVVTGHRLGAAKGMAWHHKWKTRRRKQTAPMVIQAIIICVSAFFVFAIFIVVMRIRRRVLARTASCPPEPSFDLAEINAMLDAGKITREEYDRLRTALLKQIEGRPATIPTGRRGFDVAPVDPAAGHEGSSSDESGKAPI